MSFKDEITIDLPLFVATDEFAEEVDVDGIKCAAQLMTYTADKSNRLQETFAGLHGEFSELYFMAEPYLAAHQKTPHRGDVVLVNGERYEVVRAENELGILHMIVSSYRANKPRFGDRRNVD